jgi:LmbE family N-acetylglucosaminyl deacetylase
MSFRSALRPCKRLAARVLQQCWSLGLRAVSLFSRRSVLRWGSTGGQRILVVAPHPDDEAMGCGGTVLLHVQSGDRVCVAIVTDGRMSRVGADAAEVARLRRSEAGEAARLMRVERLEWIGFPEGNWSIPALKDSLRSLLQELRPDVIYAPSRIDFHPEHRRVAHALALALGELGTLPGVRVRIYQIQVPLSPVLANLVTDVSAVQPQCTAVLGAYRSQAGSIACTFRQRRYSASWHRISGQAEEFWELSPRRYVTLHGEPPTLWADVFRGLRPFPLTDPLAYLAGRRERYRLTAKLAGLDG